MGDIWYSDCELGTQVLVANILRYEAAIVAGRRCCVMFDFKGAALDGIRGRDLLKWVEPSHHAEHLLAGRPRTVVMRG